MKHSNKEYRRKVTTEEKVILAKYGNAQELNNLIESFEPLIKNVINSKCSGIIGIDYEDALQEGRVGFLNAIKNFNENLNISFTTFAKRVVENSILSYIRNITSKTNSLNVFGVPLNNQGEIEEIGEEKIVPIASPAPSPEEEFISSENIEKQLLEFKESLSEFEKTILDLKLEGYSYGEIASQLSKTKKSIDNAMNRIKTKITTKRGK